MTFHYKPEHPRCLICNPNKCRKSWVYVAHDRTLGLVKIGKSVNVSARFIYYRKKTGRDIQPITTWQPSCNFLVTCFEEFALSLLPEHRRVRGDWYDIEPETAVRAVHWVAGGLS